jgi:hypothetical protein
VKISMKGKSPATVQELNQLKKLRVGSRVVKLPGRIFTVHLFKRSTAIRTFITKRGLSPLKLAGYRL